MTVAVIFLLLFIFTIAAVGFVCYRQIKKTYKTLAVDENDIGTTKEYLPIKDISGGIVDLGSYQYRVFLECSSINFHLRSPQEQEIIEMTYMRFLHNRNFPIVIHIATRKFNFNRVITNFKTLSKEAMTEFGFGRKSPMAMLAEDQIGYLNYLENSKANMQKKRKYIIVPFDLDESEVSKLDEKEKREFAISQIMNRVNMIEDDLGSLKINCKLLNTKEVVEVFFSAMNREKSDLADMAGEEKYNAIFVDSDINSFQQLSSLDLAGLALTEAINKLSMNASNGKVRDIVEVLEELKAEIV